MTRALLLVTLSVSAYAADITGQWNFRLIRFGEEVNPARVELKAEGSKLTGTINELKVEGTVEGDQVHIKVVRPNGSEWGKLDGRINGDTLTGTVKQGNDEFNWKATRAPAAVAAAPKTHTFEPTQFHRVFAGTIPPALH